METLLYLIIVGFKFIQHGRKERMEKNSIIKMIMIVFVMAGFSLTNGIASAKDTAKESARSETIGARESKHPAAQTVYECRKTD